MVQVYKTLLYAGVFMLGLLPVAAQYAPAAGQTGSTAIYKTDTAFVQWATGCTLVRGLQNVADTSLGYASVGNGEAATGKAGENGVASLGDGGMATLTFQYPVSNGRGFDFAVFENGFPTAQGLAFLEFAFVEVSSDGVNFTRFPAISNIPDTTQMKMEGIDCSLVNNLAGKYIAGYGTPFDLEELAGTPGLDLDNITHIRIIDVVGAIDERYATRDSQGKKINDPWPTAFESSGFDLDAVGVINMNAPSSIGEVSAGTFNCYPNPVAQGQTVQFTTTATHARMALMDISGRQLYSGNLNRQGTLSTAGLSAGMYFITVETGRGLINTKLLVR